MRKWLSVVVIIGLSTPVDIANSMTSKTTTLNEYGTARSSEKRSLTSLRLERKELTADGKGLYGELYVNDKFICYTLENVEKKIPPGTYQIIKVKKGYRLVGVAGRTEINIEIGNYPFESIGCIFVGLQKTPTGLRGSKSALLRLVSNVSLPAEITLIPS